MEEAQGKRQELRKQMKSNWDDDVGGVEEWRPSR
jgi:hypothetical protein